MGQCPGNWRATADELRYSAIIPRENGQILIDSHKSTGGRDPEWAHLGSIGRTYLLLLGFASENLVNGLCVAKDPSIVNSDQIKWGGPASRRAVYLLQTTARRGRRSLRDQS